MPLARLALAVSAALLALLIIDAWVASGLVEYGAPRAWPIRFIDGVGWLHRPGEVVVCSDGNEFATRTPTNSLGMLDEEPTESLAALVLGDSFVQACEVPIDEKLQSILQERIGRDVVALGYSGLGTVAELALYREVGASLGATALVLVVGANDFPNNSHILEAIRNGSHPLHPEKASAVVTRAGVNMIDAEKDARRFARVRSAPTPPEALLPAWLTWSGLARWYETQALASHRLAAFDAYLEANAEWVRGLDRAFSAALDGWTFAGHDSLYAPFTRDVPPPAWRDALTVTDWAIRELAAEAETLVIVANADLSAPDRGGGVLLERLRETAHSVGATMIDLGGVFEERGGPAEARWTYDGHWNPTGHRWAAEAVGRRLHAMRPDTR